MVTLLSAQNLSDSNFPEAAFKSTDEPVKYEEPTQQYRFEGFKAGAQLEATMRVPAIDFTFKTDPLETSRCDFAVMGTEVNGKYYEAARGR